MLGFFISGHPLERFRDEVELFGTRTTATLGEWSEHQVSDRRGGHRGEAADLQEDRARSTPGWCWRTSTAPPRRSSFPTPGPSSTRRSCADAALLLTGGYSDRDRGEDHAPFIVESARPLDELKTSGARGAEPPLAGARGARSPRRSSAAAALCSAHPGPTPLYIEWSDGNGEAVRLRSRRVRVAAEEDLVRALRDLLGADSVHYVKAG